MLTTENCTFVKLSWWHRMCSTVSYSAWQNLYQDSSVNHTNFRCLLSLQCPVNRPTTVLTVFLSLRIRYAVNFGECSNINCFSCLWTGEFFHHNLELYFTHLFMVAFVTDFAMPEKDSGPTHDIDAACLAILSAFSLPLWLVPRYSGHRGFTAVTQRV